MPILQWSVTGTLSSITQAHRIMATPNNNVFVAGNTSYPYGYVWKTTNGGSSWTAVSLASIAQFCFDITQKDNNNLFVSTREYPTNACSAAKSTNAGSNWSDLTNAYSSGDPHSIVYDANNSNMYLGMIGSNARIFRSSNDGSSWTLSKTLSANENPEKLFIYGSYVYCVTDDGTVYRATSGGDSWSQLGTVPNVSSLYAIYVDSDIFLIGGLDSNSDGCVWKSTNGGTSWTQHTIEFASNTQVNEIIKVGSYYVLCGNNDTLVRLSLDGINWIISDVPGIKSNIVSITSAGTDLYVIMTTSVYKTDASILFVPTIPQNVTCTPGTLKNTLDFDSVSGATSYNAYWTKSKIKNEYFPDLDRWTSNTSNGTVSLESNKLRCDVTNGYDGWAGAIFDEAITFEKNNSIEVSIKNYFPDDTTNGVMGEIRLTEGSFDWGSTVDSIALYFRQINSTTFRVYSQSKVNSSGSSVYTDDIPCYPTDLKIVAVYQTLYAYYCVNGVWYLLHSRNFGNRISNVDKLNILTYDTSLNGGYVEFDNILHKPSIKNFIGDSDTETFENLDNWSTVTGGSGGTSTIVSNQLVMDLPASTDEYVITSQDSDFLPEGEWELDLDIVNYNPDSTTSGFNFYYNIVESSGSYYGDSDNVLRLTLYQLGASDFRIGFRTKVNGVQVSPGDLSISSVPTKFKVIKSNNIIYAYYYTGSSWIYINQREFGQYADLLKRIGFNISDRSLNGGSITLDNLLVTSPGTSTKISGITTIPYDHITSDDDEYLYTITAINGYGEGDESLEVYGSPSLLTVPGNPYATAGIEKVTVGWDSVVGATSYNIYWDTSPGVTKLSNKIEDVTSPYIHQDLEDYTYYYRITAVNPGGESDLSDEVYADPWYGPPAGPTNFNLDDTILPDSECTLLWDSMDWTDSYNVYYIKQSEIDALSRIKKTTILYPIVMEYGTKLENVISPLNLIDLTAENYYFVVVGVNIIGEGTPASVLIVDIKFDGKIFNHTEQMLNSLLQQYKLD